MVKKTFKVADGCRECSRKEGCKITGISRSDVYQSLKDAKLHAFIDCAESSIFTEVKEEI